MINGRTFVPTTGAGELTRTLPELPRFTADAPHRYGAYHWGRVSHQQSKKATNTDLGALGSYYASKTEAHKATMPRQQGPRRIASKRPVLSAVFWITLLISGGAAIAVGWLT